MMQLRRLDLQPALLRAGSLGEDVEDQLSAVDHLDLELALQVALLPRRQLLVEDQQVEVGLMLERVQRLDLTFADEQGRIGLLPPLGVGADHHDPGGSGQLAQLEHLLFHGGQPLVFVVQ